MFIAVQVHDMFFSSSFLNKYEFFESVLIPCKFNVSFLKMIIISYDNQFFFFYIFLYGKLILFLTYHVHFISFMCDKRLLKF